LLLLGASGCASAIAPSKEAEAPTSVARCQAAAGQEHPLVVAWSAGERAALEERLRGSVVPVRYDGCDLEVLRCESTVAYAYRAGEVREHVAIDSRDGLFANLPLGAPALEQRLDDAGHLEVTMTIAGRYEAEAPVLDRAELRGAECGAATHAVLAATVGTFELDGNPREARCEGDGGCSELLRLELVPIGELRQAEPECPPGLRWTGAQCEGATVAARLPDADPATSPSMVATLATICGVVGAAGIVATIVWAASAAGDEPSAAPAAPDSGQLGASWSF
jgi:hypothetical protein